MATKRAATPKEVSESFRAYTAVVGEIIWASNYLGGEFEILFCHIATQTEYPIGRAIWHASPSDGARLQMLASATEASKRLSKKMRTNIIWVIEKAQKLAESRNDAAHSLTGVSSGTPAKVAISQHGTKPKRYARLESKSDLKKHYRLVGADLWRLGAYVRELWSRVAGFDDLPPLPRRPRLVSVARNNQKKPHRRPNSKSPLPQP